MHTSEVGDCSQHLPPLLATVVPMHHISYASISTFFKFASIHTFPRQLSVISPQVRAILQQIHFTYLVTLSICHHTPTTFNMSIVFCFRLRVYSNYHPSRTNLSYIHSQELDKEIFARDNEREWDGKMESG